MAIIMIIGVAIMAMAIVVIIVVVIFFLLLAFLLVLRVRVVLRFLFLRNSLRSFFLFFLHPSDFFRPFIEPRAPVKGLTMNSGCAVAL
jgi:hypothetical protein